MLLKDYKRTSRAHRKASEALATALQAYDITPKEFEALSVAHNMSQGQIALELKVTLPQVTALTRELERHHYITMKAGTRDGKVDRRIHICVVTKKGKDLLERIG